MSHSRPIRVARTANILDERAGYRVRAPWGHVGVLESGGHLCELRLDCVPGLNPLWKPQWRTIDPHRYIPARHERSYGPAPDGRLLAGIAGHSLSFDLFGPPSKEETLAGLTTHGEAPVTRWQRVETNTDASLRYGCTLREARIELERDIAVDPAHPVIYCEERARNLSCFDRPLSWNEHVTFGPPFLEPGVTIFDMPATRAKVAPAGYSRRSRLTPDVEFNWPQAPGRDGRPRNLRKSGAGRFGHYTAQLLDPSLEFAFISACHPVRGLLVVYVFRRADFPWVGNWEESRNREGAPWSGRTVCRGLEFSTTPFAVPRRETIDAGRLFGESTYAWLPAKSTRAIRFMILLLAVEADFPGVGQVDVESTEVRIAASGSRARRLIVPVKPFLQRTP